MRWKSDKQLHY